MYGKTRPPPLYLSFWPDQGGKSLNLSRCLSHNLLPFHLFLSELPPKFSTSTDVVGRPAPWMVATRTLNNNRDNNNNNNNNHNNNIHTIQRTKFYLLPRPF